MQKAEEKMMQADTTRSIKEEMNKIRTSRTQSDQHSATLTKTPRKDNNSKWKIDDVIDGKFILIREINRGSEGVTWEAKEKFTKGERRVAIKQLVLGPHQINLLEPLLADKVKSEYVVDIYGTAKEIDKIKWYAMEYIDGEMTLAQFIETSKPSKVCLINIFILLCEGLKAMSKANINHCDLKPENILIRKNGNPVIIDFGRAIRKGETYTGHNTAYYPVEKLRGTEQGDVCALGLMVGFSCLLRLEGDELLRYVVYITTINEHSKVVTASQFQDKLKGYLQLYNYISAVGDKRVETLSSESIIQISASRCLKLFGLTFKTADQEVLALLSAWLLYVFSQAKLDDDHKLWSAVLPSTVQVINSIECEGDNSKKVNMQTNCLAIITRNIRVQRIHNGDLYKAFIEAGFHHQFLGNIVMAPEYILKAERTLLEEAKDAKKDASNLKENYGSLATWLNSASAVSIDFALGDTRTCSVPEADKATLIDYLTLLNLDRIDHRLNERLSLLNHLCFCICGMTLEQLHELEQIADIKITEKTDKLFPAKQRGSNRTGNFNFTC